MITNQLLLMSIALSNELSSLNKELAEKMVKGHPYLELYKIYEQIGELHEQLRNLHLELKLRSR